MDKRRNEYNIDPIYLKKIDLGPHGEKVVFISESPYNRQGLKSFFVWGIASLVIGFSAMSFVVGGEGALASLFSPDQSQQNTLQTVTPVQSAPKITEGSNDSDGPPANAVASDTPAEYYFKNNDYTSPKVNAISYLVADADTGEVILSKDPDGIFPPASLTKLLTTLVATENMPLNQDLLVTSKALSVYGSEQVLEPNEHILLSDILYPLLMESSNNAAEVIAENYKYGKDPFVGLMNQKAESIGMTNSTFVEPSGVSHENLTTANDLLKLALYIYKEDQNPSFTPNILNITQVKQYEIANINHIWYNGNQLMQYKVFLGGKNGYTEAASETAVAFYRISISGTQRNIVVIVLKSPNRNNDVGALLGFIENHMKFSLAGNPDQN